MNTIIRPIEKKDKKQVIDMMREFYNSDAVLSNGSEDIYKANVDTCISNSPYLEGYVFEDENIIRGYAMLAKSYSTEFGKQCIWIEDIYIEKNYRRLGLASSFFDFIEKLYPKSIFRLEAEKNNFVAVSVYEKNGFKLIPYLEMKK